MSATLFDADWRALWGDHLLADVGSVYTRPEVVELILDVAGYQVGSDRLAAQRILEPSCGSGAFLSVIISRLISSELSRGNEINWSDPILEQAICALDLNESAVRKSQVVARECLTAAGCSERRAEELAILWVHQSDFLLAPVQGKFRWIVGNPPYVRLEDLPKHILARYRSQFVTLSERADLYIAFFERGLHLLGDCGVLTYICANRFVKNKYGGALRKFIAKHFHVRAFINLEHTQPFVDDVSAYPAIISIDREHERITLAGEASDLSVTLLQKIKSQFTSDPDINAPLGAFKCWYPDGEPWQTTSLSQLEVLNRLEKQHPLLENSGPGTTVGIGVATGADDVFVLEARTELIEDSRQIPLAMSIDVQGPELAWSGHYLINPFEDESSSQVVDLQQFPRLARFLHQHESALRARYVAINRPQSWYRTIDRIWPSRTFAPKLLIPDIQSGGSVAYDEGRYYPHHNLYWVTSQTWNLLALQTLLRSSYVEAQLRCLSVQMRGGSLRYQAQSLRKLRIPHLSSLSAGTVARLAALSKSTDQAVIDEAAGEAFRLTLSEISDLVST